MLTLEQAKRLYAVSEKTTNVIQTLQELFPQFIWRYSGVMQRRVIVIYCDNACKWHVNGIEGTTAYTFDITNAETLVESLNDPYTHMHDKFAKSEDNAS